MQAAAARGVLAWLLCASHKGLAGSSQLIRKVLHLSASGSALTRGVLVEHASVFARQEVLQEGFAAPPSKASRESSAALRSQELALLQVMTLFDVCISTPPSCYVTAARAAFSRPCCGGVDGAAALTW